MGPTFDSGVFSILYQTSRQNKWLNDSLPELTHLARRGELFDAVMLSAVWMHLDKRQRQQAMPAIVRLMRTGAVAIFSLRHGPVPPGRRMFDVSAGETIELGRAEGLSVALKFENQAGFSARPGVTWTRLALSKIPEPNK